MDILEILQQDYQNFPVNQTYSIYAEDVYFQDPLNKFYGVKRYQNMIDFISRFFVDIKLDLHDISRSGDTIKTEWTLNWTAPVPWRPRMAISGYSELKLNASGAIASHIDYWHCSRLDVLKQLWPGKTVN